MTRWTIFLSLILIALALVLIGARRSDAQGQIDCDRLLQEIRCQCHIFDYGETVVIVPMTPLEVANAVAQYIHACSGTPWPTSTAIPLATESAPLASTPLPLGTPGLMLVRGPNVMQGYLGRADKTEDALRDGWYVTGDIAAMDEDGFLTITDRLSRFSKIGGEMVPHLKVEEKLHELAGATEQTFVVTGVPDGKKGERLVVLHTLPDDKIKEIIERLSNSDLPNLWVPRANQFFRVEKLPYLGSGKLDLRRVREDAVKLSPES